MSELPPNTISIIDPLDRPVWGGANIAKVIGKTTGQTFYLLERGFVDADKVGRQWRSTARRLLAPGHVPAKPTSAPPNTATPNPVEPPPPEQHAIAPSL
jgi:hypothetical protein